MKIFSKNNIPQVIGLDIGNSEIKAVQLKKTSDGKVALVGYDNRKISKPKNIDPIVHPQSYISALSGMLQSPRFGKLDGSHFILGLPARHMLLKSSTNKDEFSNIAINKFGVEPEQIHIQTFIKNGNKSQTGIASLRATLDPHLAALNSFRSVLMSEHEAAAVTRSLAPGTSNVIMVDIGSTQTVIGSFDHSLQDVGIIDFGVNDLITAFMQKAGLKEHEAEEILFGFGFETSSMQIKFRESSKPIIIKLAEGIQKFVEQQDFEIEKIILHGGGACIPAFATYISRLLNYTIETSNPWLATDIYPLKPMPKKIAPQFSVAVGLALLGLKQALE